MARIAGVNIPTGKRVVIALTYIHGIGRTKAREICEKIGIQDAQRVGELSDDEVLKIQKLGYKIKPEDLFTVVETPEALIKELLKIKK